MLALVSESLNRKKTEGCSQRRGRGGAGWLGRGRRVPRSGHGQPPPPTSAPAAILEPRPGQGSREVQGGLRMCPPLLSRHPTFLPPSMGALSESSCPMLSHLASALLPSQTPCASKSLVTARLDSRPSCNWMFLLRWQNTCDVKSAM